MQEDILDPLLLALSVAPVLASIPGLLFENWSEELKHHLPVSLIVRLVVISIGASMSVQR